MPSSRLYKDMKGTKNELPEVLSRITAVGMRHPRHAVLAHQQLEAITALLGRSADEECQPEEEESD